MIYSKDMKASAADDGLWVAEGRLAADAGDQASLCGVSKHSSAERRAFREGHMAGFESAIMELRRRGIIR